MIKTKHIFLFILQLLVGCSSYEYTFEEYTFTEQERIDAKCITILNDNLSLRYPTDMLCVDNYILLLTPSDSPCLYIFDKNNGNLVNAVAEKGRGPTEVLNVNCGLFLNNGYVGIFDGMNSRFLLYPQKHLSDSSLNKYVIEKEIPNIENSLRACIIGDSILVRTTSSEKRFLWVDEKQNISIAKRYFPVFYNEDLSVNSNILSYANLIGIKPSGDRIVETAYLGGIMEIMRKEGNEYKQLKLHTYTKPLFEFTDNNRWVTWSDDTYRGFLGLSVTNNRIIAHYGGNQCREDLNSTRLRVYDWDGNPLKEYIFDKVFKVFSYDDSANILYAVIKGDDGRFVLCKYDLEIR